MRCSLDRVACITEGLCWRGKLIVPIGSVANSGLCTLLQSSWTRTHHMDLLSHDSILLPELLDLVVATTAVSHHFLKLRVLLFKNKELLVKVVCSALSFQIENVLEVLDFLLELGDESIIGC